MFKVTDYFFTPNDIIRALHIRHFIGLVAAIFVAAGLVLVGAGNDVTALASVTVAALIWRLDARIPFGAAIVCFVAIMVASIANPNSTSNAGSLREGLAVVAFYCLVIGVLLLIREHIKTPTQKPYIPARKSPTQTMSTKDDELLNELANTDLGEQQVHAHHDNPISKPAHSTAVHQNSKPQAAIAPIQAQQHKPLQAIPRPLPQPQPVQPPKPVPLPYLQRSPYLLDLRAVPKKAAVAKQHSTERQSTQQSVQATSAINQHHTKQHPNSQSQHHAQAPQQQPKPAGHTQQHPQRQVSDIRPPAPFKPSGKRPSRLIQL